LFPAEERYVRDHHALCGKIIPQSGKDLLTFGIFPGKKSFGMDAGEVSDNTGMPREPDQGTDIGFDQEIFS
jgi:hypothetical protein